MTGADRQWLLNRRNFEGRWLGSSTWYLRPGGLGAAPAAPLAPLDLAHPSRVIEDTCYAISFRDDDNGLWEGSGLLLAPEGRRCLSLSRSTYNRGGQCWQFEGAGGQSSLAVDAAEPRFGHEINLFHGRSRSMLVLLWGRHGGGDQGAGDQGAWWLDAVGAVPFRCRLQEPPDPARGPQSVEELLAAVAGWPGTDESLEPHAWPADPPPPQPCDPFDPAAFAGAGRTAAFADRLVCAVPEQLPAGAFRLEVGCRLALDAFSQVSLLFDDQQRLQQWQLRRFRPPGPGAAG